MKYRAPRPRSARHIRLLGLVDVVEGVTDMVGIVLHNRVERALLRRTNTPDEVLMPAMVTDLETVLDALDIAGRRMQQIEGVNGFGASIPISYEFMVTSGYVTREQLMKMGVHERNSLYARVSVGQGTLVVSCAGGTVGVYPEGNPDYAGIEREAVRILLQGGSWRPSWRRLARWLPYVAAAVFVIAAGWLLVTSAQWHPAAIIAAIASAVLLGGFAYEWSEKLRQRYSRSAGPIKFRAQSRQELYASRADRLANFKVALVTAPVSIAVALFIAWATGFVSSKP